ncbi:YjbE family putative metal transport protein [Pseudomonas sp. SCB32]|uniref:YjbE family putative metal transport protein n=1 Tax=Pseudomonas sp. SCB32 TaxID=2653853 RepID=UPI001264DC39|nr:YjbE family putative metal transport protein [Pseudomonas sp. SCB32]
MEADSFNQSLSTLLQVVLLDLLLSGDNVLVIALVCNGLPEALRRRAVLLATGLAIGLRVVLTLLVSVLLYVPLLKLVGAGLLLVIAIRLLLDDEPGAAPAGQTSSTRLASAVITVVSADAAMSLDNVMGLAGAAQGSLPPLLLGLLLSIPMLMYGSLYLMRVLERAPWLLPLGSVVLAWIAGRLACGDPLLADWIDHQAPALQVVVPLCCVVFVLLESRIIGERAGRLTPQQGNTPTWLSQRLGYLGERLLGAGESPLIPIPDNTRLPREEPSPPVPAPSPSRTEPAHQPAVQTAPSGTESNLAMRMLMWVSLAICLVTLLWLGAHLLNHGLLPPPRSPA